MKTEKQIRESLIQHLNLRKEDHAKLREIRDTKHERKQELLRENKVQQIEWDSVLQQCDSEHELIMPRVQQYDGIINALMFVLEIPESLSVDEILKREK